MDNFREVWHDPSFEADAARIEPNAEQWDEIIRGVEWRLARDPRSGERVGHTNVWAVPIGRSSIVGKKSWNSRSTTGYRFDEQAVTLIAVTETVLDW